MSHVTLREVVVMAMTPEERRRKNRERQARHRAAQKDKAALEALPRIGPAGRDSSVTGEPPKSPWLMISNEAAAIEFLESLDVPASAKPQAVKFLRLARDLDSDAIAQRSAIAQRYDEAMVQLIEAAKPRERDELDDMRRRFYTGGVDGIDDDPEERGKSARREA